MAHGLYAFALVAGAALLGIVASSRAATRPRQPRYRAARASPLPGAKPVTVKGSYLNRRSETHQHRGIDLRGYSSQPARAAGAGVVTHAGAERPGFRGYGPHHVVIDHGGVWTLYAHLDRLRVRPGDRVSAGQVIGELARSVAPPHVHFEVAPRAYPMDSEAQRLDPSAWLRGEL